MKLDFLFFLNSILFGIGLAMDAFSVSLANGLNHPSMGKKTMGLIAGTFGAFQLAMPLVGWVCVHTIVKAFNGFLVFVPWIALLLLLFIGGKMLIEGIRNRDEQERMPEKLGAGALLLQGVATSIDALSVGFTIAEYPFIMALTESLIIGIVTLFICVTGLAIGKKAGTKLSGKASILGGVILIAIGIEIFLTGIL